MDDKKTTSTIETSEASSSYFENPLPKDINFSKRKEIIHEQLKKLLGRPTRKSAVMEARRLKNERFELKKIRRKIASKSRRRNMM